MPVSIPICFKYRDGMTYPSMVSFEEQNVANKNIKHLHTAILNGFSLGDSAGYTGSKGFGSCRIPHTAAVERWNRFICSSG